MTMWEKEYLILNLEKSCTFFLKVWVFQCLFLSLQRLLKIQLYPTDLRAAWGAAHIRPLLFVIHVIHKPAKHKKEKTKCEHAASSSYNISRKSQVLSDGFIHRAVVFSSMFLFTQTLSPQINNTTRFYSAAHLVGEDSWKCCVMS